MQEHHSDKDTVDFKHYFKPLIKYWYVPIFFFAVSLSIAWWKVKYAVPLYTVQSAIQIKDQTTRNWGAPQFLQSMNMFSSFKNIDNEISILSSYPIIQEAVKELDNPVVCRRVGDVKDYEFYNDEPIQLVYDSMLVPANIPMNLKVIDDEYFKLTLTFSSCKPYDALNFLYIDTIIKGVKWIDKKFKFNEPIIIDGILKFSFKKRIGSEKLIESSEYQYIFNDLENLTYLARNRLKVFDFPSGSSIVKMNSTGPVVKRECDFLNKLVEVYIRKGLEDKNRMASNTVNFIDIQLGLISDSLRIAENKLAAFKSGNKMYNVEKVADQVYQKLLDLERQKSEMDLKMKYYEYLKQYLTSDKPITELVAPTTVNIDDPLLNRLVGELVNLYQEKNSIKYTSSEKSPAYQTIMLRIKSTKDALLENVNNIVNTSNVVLRDLNNRIYESGSQLQSLPAQERDFINIQRKFDLNDGIYNYLLEKRAEASIAKASNQSDVIIIDYSRPRDALKVYPTPNNNYAIAAVTGLLLSVIFTFIVGVLDKNVGSKEDVVRVLSLPIIGAISLIKNKEWKDVHTYLNQGLLTECFRTIRVNINYLHPKKDSYVIGVTSCVSGDGKSFTSLNLAKIQALAGKKVVMICADMRKKMDNEDFGIQEHEKGLSDYLINEATLDQICVTSGFEGVDIITSGGIPPNASELLTSDLIVEMFQLLKLKYDLIVVDSPPIGLVSDYQSLIPFIDLQLFVIRIGNSPKSMLTIFKQLTNATAPPACIVINGHKDQFKYGYGYGYGVKNKNNSWFKNYFNK